MLKQSAMSLDVRKEMFYLTTHSTHFIYIYMTSDMVKDHSDSEKGNPLPPHTLLFPIKSKGSFICTIPQTELHIPQPLYLFRPYPKRVLAATLPSSNVEYWLEREIPQRVHPMKDRSDDPSHHERTLLPQSYISLPEFRCTHIMSTTIKKCYSHLSLTT